jgi:predicted acylesterase/phospholipase RssA
MDTDDKLKRESRRAELQEKFRSAVVAHATSTPGTEFSVLALSGGGQWGAFGAGFLKGWTLRQNPPKRPVFDIVTGTSTGALIATFAFLGSSGDDAIRDAYLSITGDRDVFTDRNKVAYLWSDSISTRRQFRSRLDHMITGDIVAAVAAEHAKPQGRRLVVGATDLLGGEFHAFDLTELAGQAGTGNREKVRQDYIDVLMASTAIPVQFPPVTLQGTDPDDPGRTITYVDGGIRRNIFVEAIGRAIKAQAEPAVPATIYCLVNGARDIDPVDKLSGFPKLVGIVQRSVDILLNESTEGNLFRICLEAQKFGMKFLVTAVPPDVAKSCGVLSSEQDKDFNPRLMKCLYDAGVTQAQLTPTPWEEDPLVGSP